MATSCPHQDPAHLQPVIRPGRREGAHDAAARLPPALVDEGQVVVAPADPAVPQVRGGQLPRRGAGRRHLIGGERKDKVTRRHIYCRVTLVLQSILGSSTSNPCNDAVATSTKPFCANSMGSPSAPLAEVFQSCKRHRNGCRLKLPQFNAGE